MAARMKQTPQERRKGELVRKYPVQDCADTI